MEFHIELIVVTQLLIKIETIYETDVAGEVLTLFVSWGKSRYGLFPGGSPDIVCFLGKVPILFVSWGNSRDVTSRHI